MSNETITFDREAVTVEFNRAETTEFARVQTVTFDIEERILVFDEVKP